MSKKLYLSFLWHMHQPYYGDDLDKKSIMPWVFLHAIKDYYDIPYYQSKFENIHSTYNLVPSLMMQVEGYINSAIEDKLLITLSKNVEDLNIEDKEILKEYLFMSNLENMIKPIPRYYELYKKFNIIKKIENFTDYELIDIEVLFLLSWCGNYLRENNSFVKTLLEKQRDYTNEDKNTLLKELHRFLPTILEFYKELEKKGQISISSTPFYHPILPLLLDINSAKDAKDNVIMPVVDSDFKEFAYKNIDDAKKLYNQIFENNLVGIWPAEGSVSLEVAKSFANNGFKWFCTDEEILFKTINSKNKDNLYKNYYLNFDDKRIDVRFRDKALSDKIGFVYSNKKAELAVKDFIESLKEIYDKNEKSSLVNVILDGENAWEYFPNNAQDFFELLYEELSNTSWIECITMDEIEQKDDIENIKLNTLGTGSWISGNFDIWIGSSEKNKAWELLSHTKKTYDEIKANLDEVTKEKVEKEFMIALGSDWFWWYGDDHFTLQKSTFDKLFRKHLSNIYTLINIKIPNEILTPIIQNGEKNLFVKKPTEYIYPNIDGKRSSYFEWLNAGIVNLKKELSVMDSSTLYFDILKYGFNEEYIFLSLKSEDKEIQTKKVKIKIYLYGKTIEYSFDSKELKSELCVQAFYDKVLEFKILRENLKDRVEICFEVYNDNKIVQSFPIYSDFIIELENLKLKRWFV